MKTAKYLRLLAAALAFLLVPTSVIQIGASEHPVKSTDGRQSKLWLVGDSSLHAYSSTANNMTVELSFTSDSSKTIAEQFSSGQLKSLDVVVPVKEMRSGKSGLDNNMQKSLKAEQNPNILFHLENYAVTPSTIQSQGLLIKATGALEIAGVKKEVELEGTLTTEDGAARIQGVKELLMTDYGIKPPKILLIKTTNDVTVHYDLWLDPTGKLK